MSVNAVERSRSSTPGCLSSNLPVHDATHTMYPDTGGDSGSGRTFRECEDCLTLAFLSLSVIDVREVKRENDIAAEIGKRYVVNTSL